jgi:hypothetical protein
MFDIVAIAFVGTQEDMAETRESRRESRGNRATASNLIPEAGRRPTPATPVAIPSNVAAVAILNRSPEGGSMTRLIYFLATFMSLSAAIEFGQTQGVGDPKIRPRPGATGLLAVSRDGRCAGQLTKHPSAEISRPCNHPGRDGRRVVRRSHYAPRGDANVHVHRRTEG